MTEEVDIFKMIDQLGEKMRTEDEKESFRIVLKSFFSYLFVEDPKSGENNLFENFMANFYKLKTLVGNAPQRIEIKASNERNTNFRELVVDLMLANQRITNLGKALSEKRFVVPTGYDAAKNDFLGYQVIISKVGRRTIKSCLEKVDSIANENDIKILSLFRDVLEEEKFYYGFEPDFEWLYQRLRDYADDYEAGDERREPYKRALESLEFLEDKVIGSALSTLHNRWKGAPHVLIPRHVARKNPGILIKLYDEAVRTYVSGNYWACIVTCRSLFEHILIKYYGASKNDNLAKIISWSEGKYNSLPGLNLHEKRNKAKEIVHEYNGEDIEEKTALSFIKTVQSLIERIPAANLIL